MFGNIVVGVYGIGTKRKPSGLGRSGAGDFFAKVDAAQFAAARRRA